MVGTTRVPLVMDELYSRLSNHPSLTNVLVLDGPVMSGDYKRDVIVLGLGEDGDSADINVFRTGPREYEETYTISLVIATFSGEGVSKTARDQAAAVLAVLENMLTNDLTLRETCGLVALGPSVLWRQVPTADGIQVRVICSITAKVLL